MPTGDEGSNRQQNSSDVPRFAVCGKPLAAPDAIITSLTGLFDSISFCRTVRFRVLCRSRRLYSLIAAFGR